MEPLATAESAIEHTAAQLGELLKLLNIKKVYYLDDYNKIDSFSKIAVLFKDKFSEKELLKSLFSEELNYDAPEAELVIPQLEEEWHGYDEPKKGEILVKISGGDFSKLDYDRTRELERNFPVGLLTIVSPGEWEQVWNRIQEEVNNDGQAVLLLFDQDLSQCDIEDFKNKRKQGQNLISEVKRSPIGDKLYCALLSHLIEDTSTELAKRDEFIKDMPENALSKKDFLALAKERISTPHLLCDGIKKTLLNGYFENIKELTIVALQASQEEALKAISDLDTYNFDHTILKTSQDEGVWEMETLFRITRNTYDEQLKRTLIENRAIPQINAQIKNSRPISDINFSISSDKQLPYFKMRQLRHNDLYEEGEIINKLHSPIENGDIFKVFDDDDKFDYYVLIAQECDLAVRSNRPLGKRFSGNATFVKINVYSFDKFEEEVQKHFDEHRSANHYLASRYKLEYFSIGDNDIGVVNFNSAFLVDLDVVDLCVFNSEGLARFDITGIDTFDKNVLNKGWEKRFDIISKKCKGLSNRINSGILPELRKVNTNIREELLTKIYPKLSPTSKLGKSISLNGSVFDFGIQRVLRIRNSGAKYLLERYHNHLSRIGLLHDFAKEPGKSQ